MTTLRSFIEQTSAIAEAFFKPDGQMLAYFHTEGRAGHKGVIACPMDASNELAFRCGVPVMLRRAGFVRWCFFTEAWSSESWRPDGPFPREKEDRFEVVTFAAEEAATGETLTATRQIWRASPGAPGRLMPLVFSKRAAFVMDAAQQAAR